ncbi:MAG: hypothetical protein GWP47_11930, partial [Actinobacteria bacterium]|nr:hypothetical protein [Actinomycetota bacterium]
AEFGWWCTDDPLAFSADRPVFKTSREEILELIGEELYAVLVDIIEAKVADHGTTAFLPHPEVRRRNAENPPAG